MIQSERAHLHVAARSHPGMTGKQNEDCYAVSSYVVGVDDDTPALFAIVADGIGGHRAGEVAAEMAVDYISEAVGKSDGKNPKEIMQRAIQAASQIIFAQATKKSDQQGMGATCACAWVIGDRLYTASIGDSRIYLMRGNHIQQVSTDHTWVQEAIEKGILTPEQARDHPNVHVIRRYLGAPQPSEVDFRLRLEKGENDSQAEKNQGARLLPGDKLLLCSDGLTDLVKEDEILQAIRRAADKHNKGLGALVDLANQRGGHDNITVVLLAVPDDGQKPKKKKSRSLIPWLFGGLFVLLALAALAAWLVFDFQIPVIFPTPTSPTSQTAQTAQPAPPLLFSSPTAAQATPVPPTATWTPLPTETPSATFESGPTYTPWPTNTP